MTFGEFIRNKRVESGLTLREFCREHGFDVGNMSKMERGVLSGYRDRGLLDRLGEAIGLVTASEWGEFYDLAAVDAGRIPVDILSDEGLVDKLPLIFCGLRDRRLSEEEIWSIIELLRRS